jgi:hypothetical protein
MTHYSISVFVGMPEHDLVLSSFFVNICLSLQEELA